VKIPERETKSGAKNGPGQTIAPGARIGKTQRENKMEILAASEREWKREKELASIGSDQAK
jgi:hypothetical protein